MPEELLTIQELLQVKRFRVVFAPLGREQCHAQATHGVVVLDPRSRVPLAKNLLHELIHVKRPMWSETRVRREEAKLWAIASWQLKAELFKRLAKGVVWDGVTQEFEVDDDASVQGRGTVQAVGSADVTSAPGGAGGV